VHRLVADNGLELIGKRQLPGAKGKH
jgi:hypothetical protein